jgi:hypothetical protein
VSTPYRALAAKLGVLNRHFSSEKAQTVQALGDAAFEIAAATKSCAVASGNKYLAGQVSFSRWEITKGRDSARCRAIHFAADDVVGSRVDYKVASAKSIALKDKIDAFDGRESKPSQGTASSSAATKELTKRFEHAPLKATLG